MIQVFKIIALLEGISLLLLFFFAMPMKYLFEQDIYVKNIGMAHGLLFIAYILLAILLRKSQKWNLNDFAIICIASIIPFGTFYVEFKYLKNT